jgi:hypothetical protein
MAAAFAPSAFDHFQEEARALCHRRKTFLLEIKALRHATPRQNGGHSYTGAELVLYVFLYSLPCPY